MIERQDIRSLPSFRPTMFLFNLHSKTEPGQDILTGWVDLDGKEIPLKR
jgi:hypothetical protein